MSDTNDPAQPVQAIAPTTADASKVYDAVLCPRDYPAGKTGDAQHYALLREFSPVLGDTKLHKRGCADHALITPYRQGDKRNHRYWPRNHVNAGMEFYAWTDRGDGVMYGVLTPEAKVYVAEGN